MKTDWKQLEKDLDNAEAEVEALETGEATADDKDNMDDVRTSAFRLVRSIEAFFEEEEKGE